MQVEAEYEGYVPVFALGTTRLAVVAADLDEPAPAWEQDLQDSCLARLTEKLQGTTDVGINS